jgi:hypothetical protein
VRPADASPPFRSTTGKVVSTMENPRISFTSTRVVWKIRMPIRSNASRHAGKPLLGPRHVFCWATVMPKFSRIAVAAASGAPSIRTCGKRVCEVLGPKISSSVSRRAAASRPHTGVPETAQLRRPRANDENRGWRAPRVAERAGRRPRDSSYRLGITSSVAASSDALHRSPTVRGDPVSQQACAPPVPDLAQLPVGPTPTLQVLPARATCFQPALCQANEHRHRLPVGCRLVKRSVLGGLHHEYGLTCCFCAPQAVADKGYHSGAVLQDVYAQEIRSHIPEPERGRRKWRRGEGKAEEQRRTYENR